jgi:hypothetical protein
MILWVVIAAVTVIISILIVTQRSEPSLAVTHRVKGDTPPVAPATPRQGMSAEEVLDRVQKLRLANAQWPDIWQALNPDGDATTQQLLIELRGPHMFNPRQGLNMLEITLQWAIASYPSACPGR